MKIFYSLAVAAFHTVGSIFRSRTDLAIENLALRQQLAVLKEKGPRPQLTWVDRGFWVLLRKLWPNWSSALVIVKPATVVHWHRRGFRWYWRRKSRPLGRPRADVEVRSLIRRMARENPTWGAPRIHGELLKLGFDVSERTISRYMPRREPDPDKVQNWKTFLKNHRELITAMDFFTVPTITFQVLYVWFIIGHDRRTIIHVNVTYYPTAAWVIQQFREAFSFDYSWRYVIFDRDSSFSRLVVETIKSFDLKPVRIMYRSPWQNGVAERWIGSCRRELVDHVIALSEDHLRRLLLEYVSYYNEDRTHYGLEKETPHGRPVQRKPASRAVVVAHPRAGGFHHRYEWRKAA